MERKVLEQISFIDISSDYVKSKLGKVCPYCVAYGECLRPETEKGKGCFHFELNLDVDCSEGCKDCYLHKLGICKGR